MINTKNRRPLSVALAVVVFCTAGLAGCSAEDTAGAKPTVIATPSPTGTAGHPGTSLTVVTSLVPTTVGRSGGLILVSMIELVSVVLDPSHPFRVWVTPNTYGPVGGGTQCSPVVQVTLTSQSAERVEIVAGTYAAPPDAPEACVATGKSPEPIAVDLLAPLGNRQAVDGTDQKIMAVLNPAEYPEPTYLPDGYRSAGTMADAPSIVRERERMTRTYWNGQQRIEIAWREGMFALSAVSEGVTRTSVNGVTATVWKDKG